MSEALKILQDECTEKQAKFIDLLTEGQEKPKAYENAGFKPKNRRGAQVAACALLTTNLNVQAYYEAKKAERDRKIERTLNITRTTQLNALNIAQAIAKKQNNPSAMVSAIREQNEMLGYHRELAPNTEKEAEKAAKMTDEEREFARIAARMRGNELAEGGIIPFKSKEAG